MQVESARIFAMLQPGSGRERPAAEGGFSALFEALAKDAVAPPLPEESPMEKPRAPDDAALGPPAEAETPPPVQAVLPGETPAVGMEAPNFSGQNTLPAESLGLGLADRMQNAFQKSMNVSGDEGPRGQVPPNPEESLALRGNQAGGQDRLQPSGFLTDQPRPDVLPHPPEENFVADSPMHSVLAGPVTDIDAVKDGSSGGGLLAQPLFTRATPAGVHGGVARGASESPSGLVDTGLLESSLEPIPARVNPITTLGHADIPVGPDPQFLAQGVPERAPRLVDPDPFRQTSPQAIQVEASVRAGSPFWSDQQHPAKLMAEVALTPAPIDTRFAAPLPALAAATGQTDPALPADQARLPPMAPAVPQPAVQQVVQAAVRLSDGAVELRLEPAELGRLHLSLVPEGEKMRVVIQAERPETLDLLRRHSTDLERDLRALGYDTAEFRFSGQDQSAPGFSRTQTRFVVLSDETAEPPAPALATAPFVAPGRLDLRL